MLCDDNNSVSIYTEKAHPVGATNLMADGHTEGMNYVLCISSSNYVSVWNTNGDNPIKKVYTNH